MTRVSQKGLTLLDQAEKVADEIRHIKIEVERRARQEIERRTLVKTTELSLLFNQMEAEGVPITRMGRATGRNFATVRELQELTKHLPSEEEVDTVASTARYERIGDNVLHVAYIAHGSEKINGTAQFKIGSDDEGTALYAETPLWNDDWTERNLVVARLDQMTDGENEYITEALAWLRSQ